MKFSEAIKALDDGKKISRNIWKNQMYFASEGGAIWAYMPVISYYAYDNSIMYSEEWLTSDTDEFDNKKDRPFYDIIDDMYRGHKAMLKTWMAGTFIYYDHADKKLVLHKMERCGFTPEFSDFMADDWEIVG